ncbi:MAG: isoprenylcysteine carboxylmethyltransferase family protein [Candidatus Omnitrophica bacterium]|nr:isoprenylcysteine carboxylmethyltransferase family protein [Candidatus Omnitrophota bacterium]
MWIWIQERLKRLFRLRFAVLYPFAIYLVFWGKLTARSLLWGGIILFSGMLIRLWSNCYAIKMGKLTTSGPYAHVRNPLYVGTILMVLGIVVMLKVFIVGSLALVAMAFAYRRTIIQEEKMLSDKFGKAFEDYKSKVPAMIPSFLPYQAGEKWPMSLARLWESREHKVFLWGSIGVIAFYLKQELWVGHRALDAKIICLIAIALVFCLLDIAGELFKKQGCLKK